MQGDDDDEFWQVALRDDRRDIESESDDDLDSQNAETEENDDINWMSAPSITYQIPWKLGASISLKLSPLPDRNGIWSPLGAKAWHACSLLVAYMLQHTILLEPSISDSHEVQQQRQCKNSLLKKHIESCLKCLDHNGRTRIVALELGSGAVGLAGIVLGLILGELWSSMRGVENNGDNREQRDLRESPRVILTDNESSVLNNLQQNVSKTIAWFKKEPSLGLTVTLPEFRVEKLDWRHYEKSEFINHEQDIQLIVGSELVYTHETAHACAKVVLALLEAHPSALVFIVQVTDRDGWSNIFLPSLRQHKQIQVTEEPMEDFDLHELASTIIPPGGTLDRFAFGACSIFNKQGAVASYLLRS